MNELALFAGAGGGILGGKLLGWRTVCAVEWEPYPASVLCARQNDGLLPPFPIWDDIRTFDGTQWQSIVDVVSGGFPCQDISAAGKGDGLDGARSSMWYEMARVVGEVRPRFVFVENSPMLTSRGGTRVIADLTALGYDTNWTVMGASHVGANHQRERIWILARRREVFSHSEHNGFGRGEQLKESSQETTTNVANTCSIRPPNAKTNREMEGDVRFSFCGVDRNWWKREPESTPRTIERGLGRVADGVAARVDRLKTIGNGQVPQCAAEAFRLLSKAFK